MEKNKVDNYYKDLGELISKYRKEKGFSLEELGLRIGIDKSAMHRIENGKPITVNTIIKLSLALDKKPKDFFEMDFSLKNEALEGLVKSKKSSKKKKKQPRTKK